MWSTGKLFRYKIQNPRYKSALLEFSYSVSTFWGMSDTRKLFNLEMWTRLSDRESARISLLSLETHYKITIGNVKIQTTLGFPKRKERKVCFSLLSSHFPLKGFFSGVYHCHNHICHIWYHTHLIPMKKRQEYLFDHFIKKKRRK